MRLKQEAAQHRAGGGQGGPGVPHQEELTLESEGAPGEPQQNGVAWFCSSRIV